MTDYELIRAVNFSSLKHIAVSPKLYRWRLEHPQPRTDDMTIGSAIHCLLLEPGKFDSRYGLFEGTRRGKDWDAWVADHPGVESLKPGEMARVRATVQAIREHREATRLLEQCRYEETVTWRDADTGFECKGRLDGISPSFVLDVKTAAKVQLRDFRRSAAERLIHAQLAFYQRGAVAAHKLTGGALPYVIVAEKQEPYDVLVMQATAEDMAAGDALCRWMLLRLQQCLDSDMWPGVAPDLVALNIPPWALGKSVDADQEAW